MPLTPTTYLVQQGDCISSIAERFGHFWGVIWNAPENATLRAERSDPAVLLPGDRLFIPTLRQKSVPCRTGKRFVFRRRGVPSALAVRFFYGSEPRKNAPYRLTVDGRERPPGTLDGEGWLRVPIPCGAAQAVVVVGEGVDARTYRIALGTIDPVTAPSGVRARLRNLGYAADALTVALQAFQQQHGLPVTGEADEATRATLVAVHGS